MAVCFSRLYSCAHSEAICKAGQMPQEQRNKVACEDTLTDQELQSLRDLPNEVKSIIEKYVVEPGVDGSILVEKKLLFPYWFDEREELLSLATWQHNKLFTTMPPLYPHTWSGFIMYDDLRSRASHNMMTYHITSQSSSISAAALDKSGLTFVTGDVFGGIASYRPRGGPLVNWKVSDKKITSIAVSYYNNCLLVADADNIVYWFLLGDFSKFNYRSPIKCRFKVGLPCKLYSGSAIASDKLDNLVVVKDCSEKRGKGTVKVSWWKWDRHSRKFLVEKELMIIEPGEVRTVVLNHAATRLAIVSNDKKEMQDKKSSFYHSYITLWDIVERKRLFLWEEVKVMKDPVSGIMLRGDDSIVVQEPSGIFARIQDTQAQTYKKRMDRYRQIYSLKTDTPRFVHPFLAKVNCLYSSPKSRD